MTVNHLKRSFKTFKAWKRGVKYNICQTWGIKKSSHKVITDGVWTKKKVKYSSLYRTIIIDSKAALALVSKWEEKITDKTSHFYAMEINMRGSILMNWTEQFSSKRIVSNYVHISINLEFLYTNEALLLH